MQTELTIINPLPHGVMAIDVARTCYYKWRGIVTFEQDLDDYLRNGMVVSRPDVFAMAKIIDLRERDADGNLIGDEPIPAWFIRVAAGNLGALLRLLPVRLPKICFCRRGVRLKVYSFDRLLHHGRIAIS